MVENEVRRIVFELLKQHQYEEGWTIESICRLDRNILACGGLPLTVGDSWLIGILLDMDEDVTPDRGTVIVDDANGTATFMMTL